MSRAQQIVGILAGVYSFYRADLTEFHIKAWNRVLQGYEVEQIAKAFDLHLVDPSAGQFLPKPADVVKQLQGTQTDRAALAWSKVLEAVQRVGGYTTVAFDEGAIHAAIEDLGGWPQVCAMTYEELPHIERRFGIAYRAHLKAGGSYPGLLRGRTDLDNMMRGFPPSKPVLIGNPDDALRVMMDGTAGIRVQITAQPIAGLLAGINRGETA
jgi:hypothetical protein